MTQQKAMAVEIAGLSVSFGHKRVLANVHLELEAGRLYGVLGPNGAGKSTLFKAILGLLPVDSGTIKLLGVPVNTQWPRIAYIPQKDEVDWDFPATVRDIVIMGRYAHRRFWERMSAADRRAADQAMEAMGITELRDRQIGALSGGQQQRVFIARALCQEAELLFLDEPFVGVDITTERRIIEILKTLAAEGKTLLVVHHDLATVPEYFESAVLINQRIVAVGPTAETFTEDKLAATYGGQLPILHGVNPHRS